MKQAAPTIETRRKRIATADSRKHQEYQQEKL